LDEAVNIEEREVGKPDRNRKSVGQRSRYKEENGGEGQEEENETEKDDIDKH